MCQPDAVKFRRIGAGFCGSVWAAPEDACAFKREDGGPGRSLLNDFQMHKRVLESLHWYLTAMEKPTASFQIQIPQCHQLIEAEDQEWWNQSLHRFPEGYSPCKVLYAERIPPMPRGTREFLIDKYCPPSLIAEIKASDANRDCIIRPYLGRRRHNIKGSNDRVRPSRLSAFSLRNFPLHVDQMEQLGIATKTYAEIMAETLAMMHWCAKMDANDVEFVLAPPRGGNFPFQFPSNILGDHTMWLLDFDCCRNMSMDQDGVEQAVAAFFRNDPYYPRPGMQQWEAFRDRYLQTSSNIIRFDQDVKADDSRMPLPRMLIQQIENEQLRCREETHSINKRDIA